MRVLALVLTLSMGAAQMHAQAPANAADSAARTVPVTLDGAFAVLDRLLPDSIRSFIRDNAEDSLIRFHMGLGMWMRSNWGLWSGSPLQRDLRARGLRHPDDMSGLILTTYRRYLRGEPLAVANEVRQYTEYWRVHAEPDSLSFPECPSGVELHGGTSAEPTAGATHRFIHVGSCRADGAWWAYEVDRGWFRPDSALVQPFLSFRDQKDSATTVRKQPD